jgi:hypothetical protein
MKEPIETVEFGGGENVFEGGREKWSLGVGGFLRAREMEIGEPLRSHSVV